MSVETLKESSEPTTTWPATLCEAFQRTAARHAERVALRLPGGEQEITWREYAQRVRAVAAGLAAHGVERGDTVAMMLSNRPEAFIVDSAALHLGATPLSVYTTSSPEQLEYLFAHSGARVVVTEPELAEKVMAAGAFEHVFVVERDFHELEASGDDGFDFEAAWRAVEPGDVAVLIYTSGTTGKPKGVELTHANVLAQWKMIEQVFAPPAPGRVMSYLPMAHVADRFIAHYPALLTGTTVTCFADPRAAIPAMPEVRPTLAATVPRIWEKLKAALEPALEGPARDALEAAVRKVRLEMDGEPVPEELAEACRQADDAVFSKLRTKLGLDEAELVMSGGAPIAGEVLEFFAAIGIPICEAWGMSESCSTITANPKDGLRPGTVGRPNPGVELKLAEDGELLVRGPIVMRGYRNDPEKTAEAIDADGWLRTGDIGEIDADGYVRIVDRKKELIINAAGKNMSPAHIENKIRGASGLVGPVVAIGDRRPYNTALVTLDPDSAAAFAASHELSDPSVAAVAASDAARAEVAEAVERANAQLSRVEQIKTFTILCETWLPDGDELTPTLKLKRRAIVDKYAPEIEAMYSRGADQRP